MPGLVPGIHVLAARLGKSWMAGTSPAMTGVRMMVHYDSSKGEPTSFLLMADPAGFLDELVDQRLADPACDILVDRLHRLAHGGVLLRRQRDDFGLAGLLDVPQR